MDFTWEELAQDIIAINQTCDDHALSQFADVLNTGNPPEIFNKLVVKKVQIKVITPDQLEDTAGIHSHVFDYFRSFDDPNNIYGTMDALQDPAFLPYYNQNRSRTIICIATSAVHATQLDQQSADTTKFGSMILYIITSPEPNALTREDIMQLMAAGRITLTGLLLRTGMTYISNRAQRLWSSIPGALLLVSPDLIFEANEEASAWFNIPQNLKSSPCSIQKYMPDRITEWLQNLINREGASYDLKKATATFWIKCPDGKRIFVETHLRPYKILENIPFTEKMSSGFEGLNVTNIDDKLHLISLRDITSQWKAEKLDQEIALARKMQRHLLPSKLPESKIFDIAAVCKPAGHVGGDLYDVTKLPSGQFAILLGDAAGHGTDSALLAALVSGAYRATVFDDPSPQNVLHAIDKALRATSQPGFVTAAYLLFDQNGSSVTYGLAGHHMPFICRNMKIHQPEVPASLPLGVGLPPSYYIRTEKLFPNDVVAVFSDGLIEARDPQGEVFDNQIPDLLLKSAVNPARQILLAVINRIFTFLKGTRQDDDITAIIIKIKTHGA